MSGARLWLERGLLAAVAVLAAVHAIGAAAPPVDDPDIWWVAAAGREMLATGHVPHTNGFSFADGARPWVMHEWLFGPPYAAGLTAFGPSFFLAVALGSCLLIMGLLFAGTLGRCQHRAVGAGLALVGLLSFDTRLEDMRPMSVAMVLPLAMTLLVFDERWSWPRAVAAIALEWVWANLHGSFPLGVALLAAGVLFRPAQRSRLTAVGLATLVTLINPYGLDLHRLVLGYLIGSDPIFQLIHSEIAEFLPLWKAREMATGPVIAGLLFIAIVALASLRVRERRVPALVSLGLIVVAVRQARHVDLAGLTSLILLAPAVDGFVSRLPSPPPLARWRGVAIALVPALALGVLVFVRLTPRPAGAWLADDLGGGQVEPLVAQAGAGAKWVTPFGIGGLVEWLDSPRGGSVLYDPRNDCFSVETARDEFALEDPGTAADASVRLDRQGADHVIAPRVSPLGTKVAALPNWEQIAQSKDWVMFARRGPP